MDVSDFYMYLFLGLWQNLFQLVSYLVIRLDDEPEIEWGFNMNDQTDSMFVSNCTAIGKKQFLLAGTVNTY